MLNDGTRKNIWWFHWIPPTVGGGGQWQWISVLHLMILVSLLVNGAAIWLIAQTLMLWWCHAHVWCLWSGGEPNKTIMVNRWLLMILLMVPGINRTSVNGDQWLIPHEACWCRILRACGNCCEKKLSCLWFHLIMLDCNQCLKLISVSIVQHDWLHVLFKSLINAILYGSINGDTVKHANMICFYHKHIMFLVSVILNHW